MLIREVLWGQISKYSDAMLKNCDVSSSLTSAPDTQLCLALKTGIYSGEKRDFLQGSCYVNTFKGVH